MASARLHKSPDIEIQARDYEKAVHGPVICVDSTCNCDVQGVHASFRNVNGEQIYVDAFFRLPKFAEQNGTGHKRSCRYNVENLIERIVAQSREIKAFNERAIPLIAMRNNRAEFRLHILMETLRWLSLKAVNQSPRDGETKNPEPPVGTRYVRSEYLLAPYLKTAKAVLSLIAAIQDGPELASWIVLKYGSYALEWSEYFFEFENYCELFNYLSEHQPEYPRNRRPIALAVEILPSVEPRLAKSGYWRVLCRSFRCVYQDSDEPCAIRPVLYVFNKQLALKLRAARYVLACGLPRVGEFQPPQKAGLSPCADVTLNIEDVGQVCRFRPMLKDENP